MNMPRPTRKTGYWGRRRKLCVCANPECGREAYMRPPQIYCDACMEIRAELSLKRRKVKRANIGLVYHARDERYNVTLMHHCTEPQPAEIECSECGKAVPVTFMPKVYRYPRQCSDCRKRLMREERYVDMFAEACV